ncbi:MAG: hypothetical protein GF364_01075 [Candidatus Lokiarchaeota archaeon]|nr:hypothetical protein [Candidatus Lokiarchaeota archaeon]
MHKLSLLAIGTKFGSTWMEAAKNNPNWEVAGCVANTNKSLRKASRKFNINKKYLFNDVSTALEETPDLDAVVVATPNQFHYNMSKLVIEHDLHLILEKPITETWDQAVDLVRLLDKHKKKGCVGQTLRGELMLRMIAHKLNNGIIGNIEQFNFECHWNWLGDPKKRWRFRLPHMFLDDIGIHQIDTIRMLLNNRKCLTVFADEYTPKSYPIQTLKATANAILTMEDNIRVNYFGSMGAKGESLGWYGLIKAFGSKGSLYRDPYGEPYVVFEGKKKKKGIDCDDLDEFLSYTDYEKIPYVLEDFYHAITEDRPPVTDLHDNINSHAILLAMKKSSEEKRLVDVQAEFPQL